MEIGQSNSMFESFKKITVFYSSQIGEGFHSYENGQFYVNNGYLYLMFPSQKRKSIINLQTTYRVEFDQ